MVTIPHGVIGLSASKWKTGLGHRSELEAAQTHLPLMVDCPALDHTKIALLKAACQVELTNLKLQ